ncbi:AsmA-like C-terminal region-containing protein [Marivirga tractuosa]|uniref:AsmA-like C-terminal region-containing protein n=1 Tax=Marivirga tractuosa TaxID=1006 RepID=UPI0035CEFD87
MSRRTLKLLILIPVIPIVLGVSLIAVLYFSQDSIVQKSLASINESFVGELEISGSHIAPFANFPYVSIDLEDIRFYENKNKDTKPLYEAKDLYLGFDIIEILQGQFHVKTIKISEGHLDIIKDENGNINLLLAKNLISEDSAQTEDEEFYFDLKKLTLKKIDIIYKDLGLKRDVISHITKLESSFRFAKEHIYADVYSWMTLDLDVDGEHTYFVNKPLILDLELDFNRADKLLEVLPSKLKLVQAAFGIEGTVDLDDDFNADLKFNGEKPDFSVFTAFAPNDVADALKAYENKGEIYFAGTVKGKAANGHMPAINVDFGCENAYFLNTSVNKKVDQLSFSGSFTNGEDRNVESMILTLQNFYAIPEEGIFQGTLVVRNFQDPYIKVNLNADVHLDFLGQFFNIEGLQRLKGQVILDMDFDELVDMNTPSNNLAKLKEGIDSELTIKNLNFLIPDYESPVTDANGHAIMRNGLITLDSLSFKIADSDFKIDGSLSDFPAVFHRENKPIMAALNIESKTIDFGDLVPKSESDEDRPSEILSDFRIKLAFASTGDQLTDFEYLPKGEFFIEDLYGKFKNYAHTFHDFHADVIITEKNFNLIDFTGEIDQTDFHFTGSLLNYPKWFQKVRKGDSKLEFDLESNYIHPSDLLTYDGNRYVPEDYKNEEIRDLKLHGTLDLHYDSIFKSADFYLQEFDAKLKIHPLKLEDFKGRVHFEDEQLLVEDFQGKMGKSDFLINMNYFLGKDSTLQKRDNFFDLKSNALDLDALMNYEPTIQEDTNHAEAFNIFAIPFKDMHFSADIKQLNFHTYWLTDFAMNARSTKNHYLYLDTLSLAAADGALGLSGYFNGSDSTHIYFSSEIVADKLDMDKLLLKFENFGQDYFVNENLHGKVSGAINSKLLIYPDFTPIIDKSEAKLNLTVYEGSLVNFAPLKAMSGYFKDKNLNLVRFDTLQNEFNLENGVLEIPKMKINSSLGFMELSGTQGLDLNMDYYLRVPLSLVTQVGFQSLFAGKNKEEVDPDQEDAIVYADDDKRIRYLNINIKGTPDDMEVNLRKDKKSL